MSVNRKRSARVFTGEEGFLFWASNPRRDPLTHHVLSGLARPPGTTGLMCVCRKREVTRMLRIPLHPSQAARVAIGSKDPNP